MFRNYCLEFKTDEPSVDERLHEQQSDALTVCQAMFVAALILRRRQEARQDEAGAVVPDAICTFEYEVTW